MRQPIECDFVIVGAGITGLWLANRLMQRQYRVIVLEPYAIGHGQSIHAQGIVHGGLKYALQGQMTEDAKALSSIPDLWADCLAGQGPLSLTETEVLSDHQVLWAPGNLSGKVLGFFASQSLASKANKITADQTFPMFHDAKIKGHFYQLNEKVLSMPSCLQNLAKPLTHHLIKVDQADTIYPIRNAHGIQTIQAMIAGEVIEFQAQAYIFSAGRGNAQYWPESPAMQTRPLKQVALTHPALTACYVHCLSAGTTPRLTITSHPFGRTQQVWYLGGQLAEESVNLSDEACIQKAKSELGYFFPWINWDEAKYACHYLERTEAKQNHGKKPTSFSVFQQQNAWITWPTKMALAPLVSETILNHIQQAGFQPIAPNHPHLDVQFPLPQIAKPFWETAFETNTTSEGR